jgi:hypothetical protein
MLKDSTCDVYAEYYELRAACYLCYRVQIKVFIEGLFSFNQDLNQFKEHLRDFLVQIRVRHKWQFNVLVIDISTN